MISRSRGIPRVTFAPAPAKWNVFNVICVDGSPIDCAAIQPTASPGSARAAVNFAATNLPNSSFDKALLFIAFRSSTLFSTLFAAEDAIFSETQAPLLPSRTDPRDTESTGSPGAGTSNSHVLDAALTPPKLILVGIRDAFVPSSMYSTSYVPSFFLTLVTIASNQPSHSAPRAHSDPIRSFRAITLSPTRNTILDGLRFSRSLHSSALLASFAATEMEASGKGVCPRLSDA
mmetsp:Transcript_27715/g.66797  ORF Transcript_27715/g.66797 Transcript_27715/m.66797 type:complete len:232 (+) Transcript_27715:1455-2150(+)